MDIKTINTPEQLHQAIREFLQSDYSHENLVKMYDDARKCVARFLGDYSSTLPLPALPAYDDKHPLDGLQDVRDWCIKSIEVVDSIVFNLERQTISEIIIHFKKLKDFPSRLLSRINSKLLKQAQNEEKADAKKMPTMETGSTASGAVTTSGTPLLIRATQAEQDELQNLMIGFERAEQARALRSEATLQRLQGKQARNAVQIYLSKDPAFNDRLSQLNNEIKEVFEKLNKLIDDTPTGKLLNIFCKLKDIPLQQQCKDVFRDYYPIDLIDVIFYNCKRLYAGIDNIIKTFEDIQTKADVTPAETAGSKDAGEPYDPKNPPITIQNFIVKRCGVKANDVERISIIMNHIQQAVRRKAIKYPKNAVVEPVKRISGQWYEKDLEKIWPEWAKKTGIPPIVN